MEIVREVWVVQKLKQLTTKSATWETISRPLSHAQGMDRLRRHRAEQYRLFSGIPSKLRMHAVVRDGY